MRRDRLTFAMMVGVPIMQLVLFGFAINSDPKQLPTAVLDADPSAFSRSFIRAMENSGYFRVDARRRRAKPKAGACSRPARCSSWSRVPQDFSRKLQRGERPVLLVEADASDPAATSNALTALLNLNQTALDHDLRGPLAGLKAGPPPFELRVQRRYNPEGITQYNIVPGLIGVVLTMTMVMMTSLAVTRERERGTMENLLATPVRPIEVMAGKILPYIIVGYVQVAIDPGRGEVPVRRADGRAASRCSRAASVLFIAANLARRLHLLDRRGEPAAGDADGDLLLPAVDPAVRASCSRSAACPSGRSGSARSCRSRISCAIVRGILLKGNGAAEILPELWPIAAFLLAAATVALLRYRTTLD